MKWLWRVALVAGIVILALIFGGEALDWVKAKRDARREQGIVALRDSANAIRSAVAVVDTEYKLVVLPRYEAARSAVLAAPLVTRSDTNARRVVGACDVIKVSCAYRDSLRQEEIRVLRDEIGLLERRPIERHGRRSAYLGGGVEALSGRLAVEGGGDWHLIGPLSLHGRGEVLLGSVRDSTARRLFLNLPRDAARVTAGVRWNFR